MPKSPPQKIRVFKFWLFAVRANGKTAQKWTKKYQSNIFWNINHAVMQYWAIGSTPIWTTPNWTTPNWTTPIWTYPNWTWTTPNWTNPNWTTPIWTEGSFGLTPFGLPPIGLPPIGLIPFGPTPIGLPQIGLPPIGLTSFWSNGGSSNFWFLIFDFNNFYTQPDFKSWSTPVFWTTPIGYKWG